MHLLRDSSADPRPEAFDPSRLTELLQDDYGSLVDILQSAFGSLREIIKRLSKELPAGNLPASLALSHELKGVSSNIGADELAALSGALETKLRNAQSDSPADYMPALDGAYDRFLVHARAYLDALKLQGSSGTAHPGGAG